ncbi:MAG: SDR family oxidoreductase, partial [Oscillospiraceae bacterium]
TFLCTKEVIKSMVKNKKGKIINISSMWGQVGASCESCYSASKGAIIAFTKACAKELAPSGINVNCIAPGVIDTEMLSSFSKADIDFLKQQTPLDKIGTVFDVANTVLFLAQPSSDFYTGQIFSPNGGFVI